MASEGSRDRRPITTLKKNTKETLQNRIKFQQLASIFRFKVFDEIALKFNTKHNSRNIGNTSLLPFVLLLLKHFACRPKGFVQTNNVAVSVRNINQ